MTIARSKRDLATFRAAHDRSVMVPKKLRDGLAALKKADGDEAWEYEMEFLRRAGVSTNHVPAYREEFAAHIVEVTTSNRSSKRAWFALPKFAEAARKALG